MIVGSPGAGVAPCQSQADELFNRLHKRLRCTGLSTTAVVRFFAVMSSLAYLEYLTFFF